MEEEENLMKISKSCGFEQREIAPIIISSLLHSKNSSRKYEELAPSCLAIDKGTNDSAKAYLPVRDDFNVLKGPDKLTKKLSSTTRISSPPIFPLIFLRRHEN